MKRGNKSHLLYMPNTTYTFLAKLDGPSDVGLLCTKDRIPAVIVFTSDGAAETFDRERDPSGWMLGIVVPCDYVARLRENHDYFKVTMAIIAPDGSGAGGTEKMLLNVIDELEKAHQLGPYSALESPPGPG